MERNLNLPARYLQCHTYLALDASSTHIGWALRKGKSLTTVRLGTVSFPQSREIGHKANSLYEWLLGFCQENQPSFLVYEAPIKRFYNAMWAQVTVQAAILMVGYQMGITVYQVSPTQAKKALTGNGKASKADMLLSASRWLGLIPDEAQDEHCIITEKDGTHTLWYSDKAILDDHGADAAGLLRSVELAQGEKFVKKMKANKKRSRSIARRKERAARILEQLKEES